jgi:SAM-dependent methyltransferase
MHEAVTDWVGRWAKPSGRVLEIGSRNINGSIRPLFDDAVDYVGVDPQDGPDVDIVGDGATVDAGLGTFDVVACTEVLEHVPDHIAAGIIDNAHRHLRSGGRFVMTCAGPGRHAHSAIDERPIRPWEFYRNVDAELLAGWLDAAGFASHEIDQFGADMRCVAWKG